MARKNTIFNSIAAKKVKKNSFDLSHERKVSMDMGYITPVLLQEVVPGDVFNINAEAIVKLAPLQAPIMHRVDTKIDYFYVPNRLVWNQWEDFITGGEDGSSLPSHPRVNLSDLAANNLAGEGSLADHFGIPTLANSGGYSGSEQVSMLPFRAYQLIYNEFFRDQNLQDETPISLGSGVATIPDILTNCTIRRKCWEKDYFTSALPDSQKGPEVLLPLGDQANLEYNPNDGATRLWKTDGTQPSGTTGDSLDLQNPAGNTGGRVFSSELLDIDVSENHTVDLSSADAPSINELRKATAVQRWLELAMRGGSRYKEMLNNFFGVRSSDARLDRPEYLGGGKNPVVVSEVQTTYRSDILDDNPVGERFGSAQSMGQGYGFKPKQFEEHGFIIGVMTTLPRTAYSQGINRLWTRFDKFDHYFPQFANLGEQEIKSKEIYLTDASTDEETEETFGYQQRYAEYKYASDSVHGDFRSSLDYWHMGRIFSNKPELNSVFVTSNPTNRIYQITDPTAAKLWCQVYHNVKALRPMPYHSMPQLT